MLPDAFYDITSRVDAARAIVGCMMEHLPGPDVPGSNTLGDLGQAALDILSLLQANVGELEAQLGGDQ